jgi:hypothetical protein
MVTVSSLFGFVTFKDGAVAAPCQAAFRSSYTTSARAASDPNTLELKLSYLGAAGEPLTETVTSGQSAGIGNGSFKRMLVQLTAPAEAVRAVATVRLAGATTTNTAGALVTGSSAILDDISLYRPYIASSITANRTTAYSGKTLTLSGLVTPKSAIGAPAEVWVKKPGGSWTKLATTTIYATSDSAKWKRSYTFKRSMRRGTYQFRTKIAGIPGYVGSTSKTVSVKLK